LYDAALVGAGGERVDIDNAIDVGLDIAGRVEADVDLQERATDLVGHSASTFSSTTRRRWNREGLKARMARRGLLGHRGEGVRMRRHHDDGAGIARACRRG
jgi:hypothetical protein